MQWGTGRTLASLSSPGASCRRVDRRPSLHVGAEAGRGAGGASAAGLLGAPWPGLPARGRRLESACPQRLFEKAAAPHLLVGGGGLSRSAPPPLGDWVGAGLGFLPCDVGTSKVDLL